MAEQQTITGGAAPGAATREYRFKVLGRTLTHLGTQMYKRREAAIAELVANSWDAGARKVAITIPTTDYNPAKSAIIIEDYGRGMTPDEVQDDYLVVARNRRKNGDDTIQPVLDDFFDAPEEPAATPPESVPAPPSSDEEAQADSGSRPVMGRKGIGKLAGFGLANRVTLTTWTKDTCVSFTLNVKELESEDNQVANVRVVGQLGEKPPHPAPSGTRVLLADLKHKTPIDESNLRKSLARRFSRRVRGQMAISVNNVDLTDPTPALRQRFPPTGTLEHTLPSGRKVRYWFGFAQTAIGTREQRGFTIMVRGRTAQSPPFFFGVEETGSGQHSTKYLVGDIEADFIDEGNAQEDVISTDRQEIDWDDAAMAELQEWGQKLTRKAMTDCAKSMGEAIHNALLEDLDLKERIARLDDASQKRATQFLTLLGQRKEAVDENTRILAERIVQAFEYRQFHDVISQLDAAVNDDPAKLEAVVQALDDWDVIETRALHEIVDGRLFILEKLQSMILNQAPETAPKVGMDNLHDLLARFPWLLEPTYKLVREETSVTNQVREWNAAAAPNDKDQERYDFLALEGDDLLVVLEIKAPGHPTEYEEIERLQRYQERLAKGLNRRVQALLLHGGTLNISADMLAELKTRSRLTLMEWGSLFAAAKKHYAHFSGIVAGDATTADSQVLLNDLRNIREVRANGSVHRGKARRADDRKFLRSQTPALPPER